MNRPVTFTQSPWTIEVGVAVDRHKIVWSTLSWNVRLDPTFPLSVAPLWPQGRNPLLLLLIWCSVRAVRPPDKLSTYVLELLAPLGSVLTRRMFGGVGLFHNGTMFGLIARDELFLKVGDTNRSQYEAAGEAPFSYETKHGSHTIGSYWRCPPDLLDDPEKFQCWVRQAMDAAIAAGRAKPKARRKRGAPS
jgi:DNA transformation protein